MGIWRGTRVGDSELPTLVPLQILHNAQLTILYCPNNPKYAIKVLWKCPVFNQPIAAENKFGIVSFREMSYLSTFHQSLTYLDMLKAFWKISETFPEKTPSHTWDIALFI